MADGMFDPKEDYKIVYRNLKRKFRCLVYENECYQEELRSLQRKLLKVSRDKNFLLDRLLQYERVDDSSDGESDTTLDSEPDDGAAASGDRHHNENAAELPSPSGVACRKRQSTRSESTSLLSIKAKRMRADSAGTKRAQKKALADGDGVTTTKPVRVQLRKLSPDFIMQFSAGSMSESDVPLASSSPSATPASEASSSADVSSANCQETLVDSSAQGRAPDSSRFKADMSDGEEEDDDGTLRLELLDESYNADSGENSR